MVREVNWQWPLIISAARARHEPYARRWQEEMYQHVLIFP